MYVDLEDMVDDAVSEGEARVPRSTRRRGVETGADVVGDGVVSSLAEHDERKDDGETTHTHHRRTDVRHHYPMSTMR